MIVRNENWKLGCVLAVFAVSGCFGYLHGSMDFEEKLRTDKLKALQLRAYAIQFNSRQQAEPTDGNLPFERVLRYQIYLPNSTFLALQSEAERRQILVDFLATQWIKDKFSLLQKKRAWR